MGEDPQVIREEIEQTRERLGETVEALGDKADVKGRTANRVRGMRDRVTESVTGAGHQVNEVTPGTQDVKQGARRAVGIAQENPLGLALGGIAIGVLAGMALPATRVEQDRIGPVGDQVREAGQEAIERGAHVASEAASSAVEAATAAAKGTFQEEGASEARELQESMRSS
ncbi:MAG: DUF3618 domain-containing protein [Thermoleophilia bacterium]|nr:DUF3618 domain-containing protein [Thermoleophilia bacterium]